MITTMEEKKAFVQKFNIFDDTFFEVVAKDKAAVEDILRIILHDAGLVVAQLFPQGSIKNLYGRSVRLDALCITGDGRAINVEIQKGGNDVSITWNDVSMIKTRRFRWATVST